MQILYPYLALKALLCVTSNYFKALYYAFFVTILYPYNTEVDDLKQILSKIC